MAYNENDSVHVLDAVRSTRDVEAAAGNFVLRAASKGIDFTGGGSVGTATNILDDYEEGTFDVTFSSGTPYTSYNKLSYTKIGSQVTVQGQFRITTASSSGSLEINNLPFSVKSQTEGEFYAAPGSVYLFNIDLGSSTKYVSGYVQPGSAKFIFQGITDNGITEAIQGNPDGYIMFSVTYRAA